MTPITSDPRLRSRPGWGGFFCAYASRAASFSRTASRMKSLGFDFIARSRCASLANNRTVKGCESVASFNGGKSLRAGLCSRPSSHGFSWLSLIAAGHH